MKLCGLRPLLTAVKSRWTIPLKPGIEPTAQENSVFPLHSYVTQSSDVKVNTYYDHQKLSSLLALRRSEDLMIKLKGLII